MSNQASHELIQALKDLALELGKTPTRTQFETHVKGGKYKLQKAFGTYSTLLVAAGLETYDERRSGAKKKLKAVDIFGKDIREVITPKDPAPAPREGDSIRTLFIGDAHFPFACQDTLSAIYEIIDRKQPDRVVQMGDIYDCFAHSRFPRSRNIYNPHEEITLGFEMATAMWSTIRRIAPRAELVGILGNHDVRPLARIIEVYPEGEVFFSIDKFFTFEGVRMHMDVRTPLDLGDLLVTHGMFSKLGDHLKHFHRSIAVAHSHRGGVFYAPIGGKTQFELNCGYIGNPESKVMGYTPYRHNNWTLGCGWKDEDGARFIAL